MSQSEVDRFIEDLKTDDAMRSELAGQASGVASVVTYATSKGYDVTPAEVSTYIQGQVAQELTDGQLDAIAGGKGHHHHHHSTSTYAAQTVAVATTEAVAAETSVNLAAEVEIGAAAAVVAAAAAVVVVVAT